MNVCSSLVASCLSCGGDLEVIATGRPTFAGSELGAIFGCTVCSAQWLVSVQMRPFFGIRRPEGRGSAGRPVCGTESGYAAHRRRKETPCTACRTAHSRAESARAAKRPRRVRVGA